MKGGLRDGVGVYIREIVFGFEDALVSTLGVITGVAVGAQSAFVVILTGTVLIFVEALSMGVGSYLSSKSAREVFDDRVRQDESRLLQERVSDNESLEQALIGKKFTKAQIKKITEVLTKERRLWLREAQRGEYRLAPMAAGSPSKSGIVMWAFYMLGGIFPLAPYFFLPVLDAVIPSIVLTGLLLFAMGFAKGKVVNQHPLKSGFEMSLLSLTAAVIGFLIGRLVASHFGIEVY